MLIWKGVYKRMEQTDVCRKIMKRFVNKDEVGMGG